MNNYKKTNIMNWVYGKVEGFQGKDLIEMDNGSFKMVRVEPFATYPSHQHPKKTEYIYVLEGAPKITIGNEVYEGEKGDFFIFPQSIKHSIENLSKIECMLLVGAIMNNPK